MPFWEIVKALTPLAAIFGLFTFSIHIYQTRILKRWRAESLENHRVHEETMNRWREESREDHRVHEENLKYIIDTQRYIADLTVREGEKTRAAIQD